MIWRKIQEYVSLLIGTLELEGGMNLRQQRL